MPYNLIGPGEVWLVGAGPGDPDLLTRKAERLLAAADTVFHDALVGPGILDLIPSSARRVRVGKRAGRHSRSQEMICDMLLRAAQAGERVVRLKGGDPGIFGREREELDHLRRHGIAVRICPGVTAACAAAASAGVSLTLRGVARKVTFVTASTREGGFALSCNDLSDRETTLAVYMAKSAAPRLARDLLAAGMVPETPALIVENASLPTERILSTRLDLLGLAVQTTRSEAPMILLIGASVELFQANRSLSRISATS